MQSPYYWRAIVNRMLDLYYQRIAKLLASIPRAHFLDLRGTIDPKSEAEADATWFDDLHPTSAAFKLLAKKIAAKIPAPAQDAGG